MGSPPVERPVRPSARAVAILGVIALSAGCLVAIAPSLAFVATLALIACALAMCLSLRLLSRLLVVASFLSRFRFPEPVSLLLEHGMALVALPAAMRNRNFRKALSAPPVVLFALFIAWNAIISLVRSPDPGLSLRIVVWLSIDLVIVVVLLVAQDAGENPIETGKRAAGWVAAAGLVIWLLSQSGALSFGVQPDPVTGAQALYATAFEANIFGSLMAMWLFVMLSSKRPSTRAGRRQWWRWSALIAAALLLSLCRAAILALLVGLVVWQILLPASVERRRALGRLVAAGLVGFIAVMAIPGMGPVRDRLGELTDLSSGTGLQRVENWKTAIRDLDAGNALMGLGTNSFGQRHLEPTLPAKPTPAYLGNLPLQVFYDSGLVGVLLIVGVLVTALPRARRSRARSLGLFAVFLVASLGTSSFWFATTWIFLARGVYVRRREVESTTTQPAVEARGPGTQTRGWSG
jgi:hypothetical protein